MEVGRILGIAYNVIPVKDLEKSAAWFVKVFEVRDHDCELVYSLTKDIEFNRYLLLYIGTKKDL